MEEPGDEHFPGLLLELPPEMVWQICRRLEGSDVLSLRAVHPYLRDAYAINGMMRMRAHEYYGEHTVRRYGWDSVLRLRRLLGTDDVRWLLGDRVELRGRLRAASPWSIAHHVGRAGGCVELVLRDCKLDFVPEAVYTMRHLRSVDLSGNRIGRLALRFPRPMELVDLSGNMIAGVDAPSGIPHAIRELRLDGNRMREVPWPALRRVIGLEILDLSNNPIARASRRAFHVPNVLQNAAAAALRGSLRRLMMRGVHEVAVAQTLGVLVENGWSAAEIDGLCAYDDVEEEEDPSPGQDGQARS